MTDLRWTAIEVPQPGDVGTDLYVQVFDERRHALRLVVGGQVRSGPSQFDSPVRGDDSEPIGWWCSDSRDHFDYWSAHALPHVIVLGDLESRVSCWAHVTADAIEPAGESAKILVPRHQVISKATRSMTWCRSRRARKQCHYWRGWRSRWASTTFGPLDGCAMR